MLKAHKIHAKNEMQTIEYTVVKTIELFLCIHNVVNLGVVQAQLRPAITP